MKPFSKSDLLSWIEQKSNQNGIKILKDAKLLLVEKTEGNLMATLQEIKDALNILEESGTSNRQITVLHCNTEYPTPMGDENLKAMLTNREKLGVEVGYSDHTLGIEIPIAAVA